MSVQEVSRDDLMGWVQAHAGLLSADPNPFSSPPWLLNYLREVAPADGRYAVVQTGRAACLLMQEPGRPHAWSALANYYTSLYSPLAGRPAAADWAGLSQALGAHSAGVVALAPLAEQDAAALQGALAAHGWFTRRYERFGNWTLPCEGLSFERYMEGRPRQALNTYRRKARRFETGADGARLEMVTEPARVEEAMRAYTAVYARSWKPQEPYPGFVPGWARACADHGWLRLGLAWVGSEPVAAQFWFVRQGRAHVFKLAYDGAHARLSAGTVLSAFMFRHVLDVDRVLEVDYLTGDDAYKRDWMERRRPRVGLVACNLRRWSGAQRAAREAAGALRARLRQALADRPGAPAHP